MKLFNLFRRKQPKLGPSIFFQRSWLTKQVDDAIYKAQFNHALALGEVKEQK